MMAHHTATHLLLNPPARRRNCSDFSRRTRLKARLHAHRLDGALERNAAVPAGSALACHAARITGFDEREHLARSLRTTLQPATGPTYAVPVDRRAVVANAELIEQVTLRLHAPSPVRARGMARLRLLLSDGRGPLYRPGRGSLTAELRGVLAAL
jgi:hypothetical protein